MPHFNESSALLFKRCIEAGIESPAELANILGNASVETDGFRTMHERLGYSSVDNVVGAVKSAAVRFTRDEIQAAIDSHDPKEIAKMLYEDRADLGNNMPGDGYKFHGRGYFQYSGRDNYTTFGAKFGVDLANNPDQAAEPEMAAKLAIAYWKDKVPQKYREDAKHAGAIINGGPNGASERVARSALWKATITPELVEGVKDETISLDQLATLGVDEPAKARHKSGAEPAFGQTMRQGDHGGGVAKLQKQLAQLGYTGIHGNILNDDGEFGPSTRHAVKAFQHDRGLSADGVAGTNTYQALEHLTLQQITVPTMEHPRHPGYPMFQQTLFCVGKLDEAKGRATDVRSYNLSGALAVAARREGLVRVDHVVLSDDATRAIAVQGDLHSPLRRLANVDVVRGVTTSLVQSTTDWSLSDLPAQACALSPMMQTADPQVAQPTMQR